MLQDLPPKITQDYYCDLSPLQRILYEDFRTRHSALANSSSSSNNSQSSHVFEALRYLRNVCNHPKLVLSQEHPLYQTVCIKKQKKQFRKRNIFRKVFKEKNKHNHPTMLYFSIFFRLIFETCCNNFYHKQFFIIFSGVRYVEAATKHSGRD